MSLTAAARDVAGNFAASKSDVRQEGDQQSCATNTPDNSQSTSANSGIACPVCGSAAIQEKCKIVCHSDICRGRIVMNCSEF
jgi:hypothetical protein